MFGSKSAFGRLFDAEDIHSITGETFPKVPWKYALWFFRERLRYPRERLAQLLGVSARTIVRWDQGETPTLRHQAALLKAMDEVPSRLKELAQSLRKTLDIYAKNNQSVLTAMIKNAASGQPRSRHYQKGSLAAAATKNIKIKGLTRQKIVNRTPKRRSTAKRQVSAKGDSDSGEGDSDAEAARNKPGDDNILTPALNAVLIAISARFLPITGGCRVFYFGWPQ